MRKMVLPGLVLFFFLTFQTACLRSTSGEANPAGKPPAIVFDHQALGTLLAAHVNQFGEVDYDALRGKRAELDAYLNTLPGARPETFSSDPERLAFWINAYNALTLGAVLDQVSGKAKSVQDIKGFFDGKQFAVAGEQLTLDEIRNRGRGFKEPRLHFALCCAAKSCPKLQRFVYSGEKLDFQLNQAAREFLQDPSRGLFYNPGKNTVLLSPIFQTQAADFIGSEQRPDAAPDALFEAVKQYLPPDVKQFLTEKKPSIGFSAYDWSLNQPTTRK